MGLVQSAQEGNKEAFRKLFEDNKNRIFSLTYHYLKNMEDAEDALQDTFIKAYYSLDKFDIQEATNFSAWLYRIGINCCLDSLRKSKKRKGSESQRESCLLAWADKKGRSLGYSHRHVCSNR